MNVIDLGLCPTPAVYFSLFHLNPGVGVMITGSHNPAKFNGFKLCIGNDAIYWEEIQNLREHVEKVAQKDHKLVMRFKADDMFSLDAIRKMMEDKVQSATSSL
jgi:phosphomannomutase